MGKCDSCGNLAELDNKHRMAQYILKNPPTKEHGIKSDKSHNGKQENHKDKEAP